MTTWLDWYVRWRVRDPGTQGLIDQYLRRGAPNPLAAFSVSMFEALAQRAVDPEAFAKSEGAKEGEELALRCACMAPFLRGFLPPEIRDISPTVGKRPVGLLLTRETADLLSDAEPPK